MKSVSGMTMISPIQDELVLAAIERAHAGIVLDPDAPMRRSPAYRHRIRPLQDFGLLVDRAFRIFARRGHDRRVWGLTTMVNSGYNGWRFEDVWLDK